MIQVRLTCRVSGRPDPQITWYKGDKMVTEDNRHKVRLYNNSNIHISILDLLGNITFFNRDGYQRCIFYKFFNHSHLRKQPIPESSKNIKFALGDDS